MQQVTLQGDRLQCTCQAFAHFRAVAEWVPKTCVHIESVRLKKQLPTTADLYDEGEPLGDPVTTPTSSANTATPIKREQRHLGPQTPRQAPIKYHTAAREAIAIMARWQGPKSAAGTED